MKLFDSRRAPNPRRVRWFIAEKGIEDLEIVPVDLLKGEHKTPEFLSRAGLGNIPALELDDGEVLTESVAICRYLEALYPEPNLFGRTPREVAFVEMWSRRAEFMISLPLMMTVRHSHPALAVLETQNAEVAAVNRAAAERAFGFFDRRLQTAPFLAGDRLTVADIIAVTGIDFARMAQVKPDTRFEALGRWLEMMRSRPAAAAGT